MKEGSFMIGRMRGRVGLSVSIGLVLALAVGSLHISPAWSREQPQPGTRQQGLFDLPIIGPILGPIFGQPPVGRQSPPQPTSALIQGGSASAATGSTTSHSSRRRTSSPIGATTRSLGTGDVGITCGTTTFDWYDNTSRPTSVMRGEKVCVVMLSNRVLQEVLDLAIENRRTLSDMFSELIAQELREQGIRTAKNVVVRHTLKRSLQVLLPAAARFIGRASRIYTAAELSYYPAQALVADIVVDQIRNQGGCIQIVADADGDQLKTSWNLVYNPAHWRGGSFATEGHVWDRIERTRRFDEHKPRGLGMSCTKAGLVKVKKTPSGVLKHSQQTVISLD